MFALSPSAVRPAREPTECPSLVQVRGRDKMVKVNLLSEVKGVHAISHLTPQDYSRKLFVIRKKMCSGR